MGKRDQINQAKESQKHEMERKRLKDRIVAYLQTQLSDSDIVSSSNIVDNLKLKFNEYGRRDSQQFEKHVKKALEDMYSEFNTTNIRKSFFRRRDLLKLEDTTEKEDDKKPDPETEK